MVRKQYQGLLGIVVLLAMVGCQPVITVGWQEMVVLFVIVAILVGPLLFRMYRFWLRAAEKQDEKRNGRY